MDMGLDTLGTDGAAGIDSLRVNTRLYVLSVKA